MELDYRDRLAMSRLTWLAAGVVLWGGLIVARIVDLQVLRHGRLARQAEIQQNRLVETPAPRGDIFDRNGQPLALSVPMDSVFVNPKRLPDAGVAAGILAPILDLDHTQLSSRISWAVRNQKGFLWVKRRVSLEEARRLRSLKLDWIEFTQESQRHYPKGMLAAQVLGSVDHVEKGNAGIELALDKELRGIAGKERMLTDVRRRGIDALTAAAAVDGADLTLTLDERIQFAAERDIAAAVQAAGAETGSVVVMNPHNGDILALASYPSYDPNKPPQKGESKVCRFNQPVSVPFEPGSVFKTFTLAAALETTNLHADSPIDCKGGTITIAGRTVHEAKGGFNVIPMSTVLAKSSNVGAIQVGLRVGQQKLHDYVRRFGFGQKTGLPLPAESGGLVRKLHRWGPTSLPSVAMGHEVSTTTVQLARACSVIANGGFLVHPRLVMKKVRDGKAEVLPQPKPQQVLRGQTTIEMRRMMEGVVLEGTGKRAKLDGWSSGGKTGSAQIFDFETHRYTHTYNASFMGFAPVANPAIVIVVTINGTTGTAGFGGAVSAPVFRTVAMEALRVLDVPKDLPESLQEHVAQQEIVLDDVAIAGLGPEEPEVLSKVAEEPAAGDMQLAMSLPALLERPPAADVARVPDFRGKSVRAVLEQASAEGIAVLVDGSGIAKSQSPAAGAVMKPGERIRVQFAR